LQKGASDARADDTKSLKSAIIDWLSPPGEPLHPPIAQNIKVDRGFNHEVTGALLCPTGMDWSDLGLAALFFSLSNEYDTFFFNLMFHNYELKSSSTFSFC
jgi:hypothetical protein